MTGNRASTTGLQARRARTHALTDEMLDCLARLVEDISARRAAPSEDPERDVKLIAQVLKAIELLEALSADESAPEMTERDDGPGGASAGPGRDAELRAALERRFDELRAARDCDRISPDPLVGGA